MKTLKQLMESKKGQSSTFPATLILRRKAVRQYPGNKNVALYYIEKLDKYVTIPDGNDDILKF
jgi:hypothetical protein